MESLRIIEQIQGKETYRCIKITDTVAITMISNLNKLELSIELNELRQFLFDSFQKLQKIIGRTYTKLKNKYVHICIMNL